MKQPTKDQRLLMLAHNLGNEVLDEVVQGGMTAEDALIMLTMACRFLLDAFPDPDRATRLQQTGNALADIYNQQVGALA